MKVKSHNAEEMLIGKEDTLLDEFTRWFLIELMEKEIYPAKRADYFTVPLSKIPSKFLKRKEHSNRYSLLDEITENLEQHNWTYQYSYLEKNSYECGIKLNKIWQVITFKNIS